MWSHCQVAKEDSMVTKCETRWTPTEADYALSAGVLLQSPHSWHLQRGGAIPRVQFALELSTTWPATVRLVHAASDRRVQEALHRVRPHRLVRATTVPRKDRLGVFFVFSGSM